MKIREHQMYELSAARKLQDECVKLNMLSPPVLHWSYDIKNAQGETMEIGRGKANSFTRNALNMLAYTVGVPQPDIVSAYYFKDGYISLKNTSGGLAASTSQTSIADISSTSCHLLVLGSGTATESLDSYALAGEISTGWTIGTTTRVSAFNSTTRKLVTTITRTFTNNTGSSVDIKESGVTQRIWVPSSYHSALMIYDTFDAIAVADGAAIAWTYTIEVAYPQP